MGVLIPSRGNMYTWITHEWRPLIGKCSHACTYCYVTAINKRYGRKQPPIRLKNHAFGDLGRGNFIFVCSTSDLFAEDIPEEWILRVLAHCIKHQENKYLFQTKNVKRLYKFINHIPFGSYIATTIETNRTYPEMGDAPPVKERADWIGYIKRTVERDLKTLVTIEPILDFDLKELFLLIEHANPDWVNIGADSKDNGLPEPTKDKILDLTLSLEKITEIKNKKNLQRLKK